MVARRRRRGATDGWTARASSPLVQSGGESPQPHDPAAVAQGARNTLCPWLWDPSAEGCSASAAGTGARPSATTHWRVAHWRDPASACAAALPVTRPRLPLRGPDATPPVGWRSTPGLPSAAPRRPLRAVGPRCSRQSAVPADASRALSRGGARIPPDPLRDAACVTGRRDKGGRRERGDSDEGRGRRVRNS
jgi:hypothetical protein